MLSRTYLGERLGFLFIIGLAGLQYPILSLVNLSKTIAGIPILYLYLFVVWAVFIGLMIVLMELRHKRKGDDPVPGENLGESVLKKL